MVLAIDFMYQTLPAAVKKGLTADRRLQKIYGTWNRSGGSNRSCGVW
jgi:hypothetical protein